MIVVAAGVLISGVVSGAIISLLASNSSATEVLR